MASKFHSPPAYEAGRLIDVIAGEWRMITSEVAGAPTYNIRLIFEKSDAGVRGKQIITPGDERQFFNFNIEIYHVNGTAFERLSFNRVSDNLDYEATFCYGHALIGTHSKGQGNWEAFRLPYK